MGTLQVGGTTLGVKNTSTNKVDLSNVGDVTLTSSANIKEAINASGSAPIYACRAWVNFNGTGTVALRDSGNVSSITDNTTGDYTVNFTTAMPDANYCAVLGAVNRSSGSSLTQTTNLHSTNATNANDYLAGSVRIGAAKTSNLGTYNDIDTVNVAIFR